MPMSCPVPGSFFEEGSRALCGHGLRIALVLGLAALAVTAASARTRGQTSSPGPTAGPARGDDPFAHVDLPDAWEQRFWADPDAKELVGLDLKALAELVPVQAGVRYCRCPGCDALEAEDPLAWSILKPKVLTCRRCGVVVPNDDIPARNDQKKVPEETIEVAPRVVHHYPYHEVSPEAQRLPDERLYLAAKRDYEAREYLSKAAMYAAVRYREQAPGARQDALARLAALLILRFAQVYPAYATHFDQPGEPKYFQQADLPPPYRRGYRTGKWDCTANLDVPMNLVIAYALIRDDPAIVEAGRVLGDPDPSRTIERDLFRGSAEFVRLQPEEFSEMSLHAYRGLLAVGRLLNDPALVSEALVRLDAFSERGFYHDGYWRQGDAEAHRRVVGLIGGWIDRLLAGTLDPRGTSVPGPGQPREIVPRFAEVPMLSLARGASAATLSDPRTPEVLQASWPSIPAEAVARHPALLGGAGLARLAIGRNDDALDLELRGLDSFGGPHFQRLAIRLAVAGRPVLGDLDELPSLPNGWDRATASHNTVIVDGLNQRESIVQAREPALGGRFLFFAADPDFQVVTVDDAQAYPQATTRYRETLIVAGAARTRYAIGVFEVHGGLQHDQIFHAAPGAPTRWQMAEPLTAAPATLLPPSITYLPTARPEDGRWFVQAIGELSLLGQSRLARPTTAWLTRPDGPGVRLHLLSDASMVAYTAVSTDPTDGTTPAEAKRGAGRAGLILRRRSEDGSTLKTTFVTVFEPMGTSATPLLRVGRVASTPETVVVYLETEEGSEHVIINLAPGTVQTVTLSNGRSLRTDGLAVRVGPRHLMCWPAARSSSRGEAGSGRVRFRARSWRSVAVCRRPAMAGS